MPVLQIGSLGPVPFALAPPDGRAEQAVDPQDPARSALALARSMARLPEGVAFEDLPVALLHRLYRAIHRSLYDGPQESRAACAGCGEEFDFTLDLDAVTGAQDAAAAEAPAHEDGWWPLTSGGRVRAPLVRDLRAGSASALMARLSEGDADPEEASALLETVAPLLDFDLGSDCPHCGTAQQMRFSIAPFLVAKLDGERPFLLREVHLIASQYGWSLDAILGLTRPDRRAYAALIQSERLQSRRRRVEAVS